MGVLPPSLGAAPDAFASETVTFFGAGGGVRGRGTGGAGLGFAGVGALVMGVVLETEARIAGEGRRGPGAVGHSLAKWPMPPQ